MRFIFRVTVAALVGCLASCVTAPPYKPITDQNPVTLQSLQDNVVVNYDKVRGVKFFTSKRSTELGNYPKDSLYPYIGLKDKNKQPFLMFFINYKADTWLFFEAAVFHCTKPSKFSETKQFGAFGTSRETAYSGISESVHFETSRVFLEKLKKCEDLTVRLAGKDHFSDFELTANRPDSDGQKFRDAIIETLFLFDDLSKNKEFLKLPPKSETKKL